jgi:putative ABC transport system substrate-binding protein
VRRRDFIALLGSAAAWPFAARAQQPAMPVIGFLRSTAAAGSAHFVAAFRQGLSEAGFVEGQNIAIEYRWADEHHERLGALAADLVRRQVAAIVANSISAQAAKSATTTTPIVFVTGSDPVRIGLVPSLSRPGGNVTGVSFTTADLLAKRLGLLHELVPKAGVIGVLLDPNIPEHEAELRELETAARGIGRETALVKAGGEGEFDPAFGTFVERGAAMLLVGAGAFFTNKRRQLVALAARHALPTIYHQREFIEAGGLMSYGASQTDAYRRAAIYVGRILKGEKAADLPVELATKFDLVINLAAAKALHLEIPPMLLARADEVIE